MVTLHDVAHSPISPTPKRRRPSSSGQGPPLTTEGNTQQSPKKRKITHPTFPPPRFWDNLSTIHLTANTLRELDRRNTELSQGSPRKRSLQPADLLLRQSSRQHLKQLKKFATHGGPELKSLRGYRAPPTLGSDMQSSTSSSLGRRKRSSRSGVNTEATKSTGPYDRTFQQNLIDHGIFPYGYEYPDGQLPPEPENMEQIRESLSRSRQSLSPSAFSTDDFRAFKRAENHAAKERQVIKTVIPVVEGDVGDARTTAGEIPFTNLDHLTDGTLVPGNPDLYHGARPEQLDRRVRERLSGRVVPSTQDDLPLAPNFFLEVKGPAGQAAVAKRQISYDMALGERGQLALTYGESGPPSYNHQAHTLGCTYIDGTLKIYATHAIEPSGPGAQPGYVMTQVKAAVLTDNADDFRRAAAAYRNARDWAKRQRDRAIEQANQRAATGVVCAAVRGHEGPIASGQVAGRPDGALVYDTDTSADELSLEFPPEKRSKSSGKAPASGSRLR